MEEVNLRGYVASGGGSSRIVKCAECGEPAPISIVTHLKKRHPETWEKFVRKFIEYRRQGLNYKRIMWKFNRLFSWTVIASALTERGANFLPVRYKCKQLGPSDFQHESTTFWSFDDRGSWALHDSSYRGNWPPQVPRNLIHLYSNESDLVLDPFMGGGTTGLESVLMGRKFIGVDINPAAIENVQRKLRYLRNLLRRESKKVRQNASRKDIYARVVRGNAASLGFVGNNSIDLICAHPPYLDIISYTRDPSDLSTMSDVDRFKHALRRIAIELYRVLKDGRYCCVQIGDVRKEGKLIPLGLEVLRVFLGSFDLKEIIVKEQPRTAMSYFWKRRKMSKRFLRIAHEYIFIFQKNTCAKPPMKERAETDQASREFERFPLHGIPPSRRGAR